MALIVTLSLPPLNSYGEYETIQLDFAEFEPYRNQMDDYLKEGNLSAGFSIFQRYHQRAKTRLNWVVEALNDDNYSVDFTQDEYLSLDDDTRQWAKNAEVADEHWRKRLKASLLSLKLTGKTLGEAKETRPTASSVQVSSARPFSTGQSHRAPSPHQGRRK